jgi:hypothetical protein
MTARNLGATLSTQRALDYGSAQSPGLEYHQHIFFVSR